MLRAVLIQVIFSRRFGCAAQMSPRVVIEGKLDEAELIEFLRPYIVSIEE